MEDFKEFVSSKGEPVPKEISASILNRIHASLNPSAWLVFAKIFSIHIVVGTVSLSICNQFGLNPFNTNFSLSEYFMQFGHSTCMFLCGILFITSSILLGRIMLKQEEFVVLSRHAPLQVFGLSVFSLVAFIALGAEIVIGIGALWLLGAMLGGVFAAKIFTHQSVHA